MKGRTYKLYKQVFKHLRDVHNLDPGSIMLDYEKASRLAAARIWPQSTIRGCWFHFNQSLRRKALKLPNMSFVLKNDPEAKRVLNLFMKLPLLPLDQIDNGLSGIIKYQEDHDLKETFLEFNSYFVRYWIENVTKEGFCVSHCAHRTNNFNEGYNSKIKKIIPRRPNIYVFLEELQNLMFEAYNTFLYDRKHQVIQRDKSKFTNVLNKALVNLENKSMDELGFLLFLSPLM